MFEAAAVGSLLAGGPVVAILGMIYNGIILGPTAFLGSAVFILFYPAMVSKLAGCVSAAASPQELDYFRRVIVARSLMGNFLRVGACSGKV